ncbi:MAG: hypothetical protein HN976_36685 [Lentisphaerae bacterium]|nr:hypothetical protein [Lentisphaerota bacterium]MBT7060688.1 hypothetical protein [Lentisphaerota bacterium]
MEVTTSGFVDWAELHRARSRHHSVTGGLEHLHLEEGWSHQIRLVGHPFRFFRHYLPIMAISPGLDHDVCWQAGHRPRERYAVLAFDRQDDNWLKYVEDGGPLFDRFMGPCPSTMDGGPGGKVAPDWLVRIVYPRVIRNGCLVKAYRHREVVVEKLSETTLTVEEQERISSNPVPLDRLLAPTPPELIARMFEEAKSLGPGEPMPGSRAWWQKNG